jgi:hypothetical protein
MKAIQVEINILQLLIMNQSHSVLFRGRTYPFFEDIISYPYPGPIKGYYVLSLSRQKKDMYIYSKSLQIYL